jgi:hypothetical protein
MEVIRTEGLKEIQKVLDQKRLVKLSQREHELEEFKRKKIKGLDARADMKFGDMLADYGEMVKTLDAELLEQKKADVSQLEDKLRNRKQARLREIEEQRKQKEQMLNSDTVNQNAKI